MKDSKWQLTQRAPDPRQLTPGLAWWESARFHAVYVVSSWFRQSSVTSSRPPAPFGDATRRVTLTVSLLSAEHNSVEKAD